MHNHTRLPPPLDPHGNLGVLAVFIHVLGDAVNSEYYTFSRIRPSILIESTRCGCHRGGVDHVEDTFAH